MEEKEEEEQNKTSSSTFQYCPQTSSWMVLMKLVACTRSSLQPRSFSVSGGPWGQCCVPSSLYKGQVCSTCSGVCGPGCLTRAGLQSTLWGLWAWLSHMGRSAEHALRFVGLAVSHGQVCRTRSEVCGPGCLTWAGLQNTLWGLWAWLSHMGRSAEYALGCVGLAVSHGQVCRTRSGVCGPGCLTWAVSCAWQTKRYRWARIRQWPVRSQQLVQCMTGLDRTMLIQWERIAWVFSPYYGLWSNAALLVKKIKK